MLTFLTEGRAEAAVARALETAPGGDVMIRPASAPLPEAGRSGATRDRLIATAIRLFQQRGYHGVGLTELLKEARAPKGSLYHHFPEGKNALAEAAIERVSGHVIAALERLDRPEAVSQVSGLADFLRKSSLETARWLEERHWRDGSLLAVLGQEEAGREGPIADAVRIAYQRIELRLAKLLIGEGVAPARARELAATIIASQEGALMLARARKDAAPLKLAGDLLAAMIEGLVRPD